MPFIVHVADAMDFAASTLPDLTFNDTSQNATVTLKILDDNLLEVDEMFRVEISSNSSNCVVLQPNFVDIVIKDNDCEFQYMIVIFINIYCSTICCYLL